MKRYSVKTQSSVNEMLLHSTMQRELATDNLDEAREAFEKEVEVLSKTYAKADEFDYSPSDYEDSHAIFCEIVELVFDEDDEVDDIISVERSDYYYEK